MRCKFIVTIGAAVAVGAAVQLNAQETSNQPVKVTGCLQRTDANRVPVPSGATGTSGSESFVLTNVQHAGEISAPPSASGQAPSVGAAGGASASETDTADKDSSRRPAGSAGPWYSVIGNLDGLQQAIDHRVEITGRLDTVGSVVGTSASVTAGPSGTIHVAALKVIGPTCR
jgi:hypothetical protein